MTEGAAMPVQLIALAMLMALPSLALAQETPAVTPSPVVPSPAAPFGDASAAPATAPPSPDVSSSSPASVPTPVATRRPTGLIVPPNGYAYVKELIDFDGNRRRPAYEKYFPARPDGSEPFDEIYAFSDGLLFGDREDIMTYAELDSRFARTVSKGVSRTTMVESGRKALCGGKPGYFEHNHYPSDFEGGAYDEFRVMVVWKKRFYEVVEVRSSTVRADPEALKSLLSLCPPG